MTAFLQLKIFTPYLLSLEETPAEFYAQVQHKYLRFLILASRLLSYYNVCFPEVQSVKFRLLNWMLLMFKKPKNLKGLTMNFVQGLFKQRDNNANEIQKHLQLYNFSLGEYLVNKYALWVDFRTIDENELHRTGRRIENASEGITLQNQLGLLMLTST